MIVSICFSIAIVFISVYIATRQITLLNKIITLHNTQVTDTTNNDYSSEKHALLLKTALHVLNTNAQTLGQPGFYERTTLYQIILKIPDYKFVIEYVKYATKYHKELKNDPHQTLVQWYGQDYVNAPELNPVITIQTTRWETSQVSRYIVLDLEEAYTIAKKNNLILSK
jgi:hypothetical protein